MTKESDKINIRGIKKRSIGTYWSNIERNECLDKESTVFAVEVPKKEHGKLEVLEAKKKEMENLHKFGTFVKVKDEGREKITSRWVMTEKIKHGGQKKEYKARIVVRGF